jgi:sugar O-acyltransferase (sialic acid O-acetyltransferase NeuD family)
LIADMYILIGNGGHARSCRDVALGQLEKLFYLSDADDGGPERLGVFGDAAKFSTGLFHLAIGPSRVRVELATCFRAAGLRWFSLISPHAIVRSDRLGEGVFIGHRAHIGPGSSVGNLAIVNTAAVVEHDCIVEDGAFVGPGAVLCGGVRVGANAMIGAGAIVVPKMNIEESARIPAGVTVR